MTVRTFIFRTSPGLERMLANELKHISSSIKGCSAIPVVEEGRVLLSVAADIKGDVGSVYAPLWKGVWFSRLKTVVETRIQDPVKCQWEREFTEIVSETKMRDFIDFVSPMIASDKPQYGPTDSLHSATTSVSTPSSRAPAGLIDTSATTTTTFPSTDTFMSSYIEPLRVSSVLDIPKHLLPVHATSKNSRLFHEKKICELAKEALIQQYAKAFTKKINEKMVDKWSEDRKVMNSKYKRITRIPGAKVDYNDDGIYDIKFDKTSSASSTAEGSRASSSTVATGHQHIDQQTGPTNTRIMIPSVNISMMNDELEITVDASGRRSRLESATNPQAGEQELSTDLIHGCIMQSRIEQHLVSQTTVLDPFCGSGRFVVELLKAANGLPTLSPADEYPFMLYPSHPPESYRMLLDHIDIHPWTNLKNLKIHAIDLSTNQQVKAKENVQVQIDRFKATLPKGHGVAEFNTDVRFVNNVKDTPKGPLFIIGAVPERLNRPSLTNKDQRFVHDVTQMIKERRVELKGCYLIVQASSAFKAVSGIDWRTELRVLQKGVPFELIRPVM